MDNDFEGTEMTARHTDGTEVKVKVKDNYAIFDIPKDGTWTVSNTLTDETFTIIFDTNKELWFFKQATIVVSCVKSGVGNYWGKDTSDDQYSVELQDPTGKSLLKTNMAKDNQEVHEYTCTTTLRGNHRAYMHYGGLSTSTVKNVDVTTNNKTYYISFTCTSTGRISDPSIPEQPSFDGLSETPQAKEFTPLIYAVNITDMTEDQIDEIFSTINSMIEAGNSEDEINEYISSMEAKYGQN